MTMIRDSMPLPVLCLTLALAPNLQGKIREKSSTHDKDQPGPIYPVGISTEATCVSLPSAFFLTSKEISGKFSRPEKFLEQ